MSPRPRVLSISSDIAVFYSRNLVLQFAGFEVVGCFKGIGAMEWFRSEVFDAVVIGHSMPERTRLRLLRTMKQMKPQVPIVLIQETGDIGQDLFEADAVCDSLDNPQQLIGLLHSLIGFAPQSVRRAVARAATAG